MEEHTFAPRGHPTDALAFATGGELAATAARAPPAMFSDSASAAVMNDGRHVIAVCRPSPQQSPLLPRIGLSNGTQAATRQGDNPARNNTPPSTPAGHTDDADRAHRHPHKSRRKQKRDGGTGDGNAAAKTGTLPHLPSEHLPKQRRKHKGGRDGRSARGGGDTATKSTCVSLPSLGMSSVSPDAATKKRRPVNTLQPTSAFSTSLPSLVVQQASPTPRMTSKSPHGDNASPTGRTIKLQPLPSLAPAASRAASDPPRADTRAVPTSRNRNQDRLPAIGLAANGFDGMSPPQTAGQVDALQ